MNHRKVVVSTKEIPSTTRVSSGVFSYAQIVPSDDETSTRSSPAAAASPISLAEHAETTKRELEVHRALLRQRSAVTMDASKQHQENELQKTVSKLMDELSTTNRRLELEVQKRLQAERSYRGLEQELQAAQDEVRKLETKLAVSRTTAAGAAASPLLSAPSPLFRADSNLNTESQTPTKSFKLVKKFPSEAVAILTSSEAFCRSAIVSLRDSTFQQLVDAFQEWAISHRRRLQHRRRSALNASVESLTKTEALQREILCVSESKQWYKNMLWMKFKESELPAVPQIPLETARALDLIDSDSACEMPRQQTVAPTPPPWYPSGNCKVNYHSPARKRSPSASGRRSSSRGSASATPSQGGVAVPSSGRRNSPNILVSIPVIPKPQMREPSPRATTPPLPQHSVVTPQARRSTTPTASPTYQPLISSPPPPPTDRRQTSSRATSVKKTIETMEALLQELQQWRQQDGR